MLHFALFAFFPMKIHNNKNTYDIQTFLSQQSFLIENGANDYANIFVSIDSYMIDLWMKIIDWEDWTKPMPFSRYLRRS